MMLKTKFSFSAFLILVVFTIFTCVLFLTLKSAVVDSKLEASIIVVYSLVLFGFTWQWLLLGELRTKVIAAKFEQHSIVAKRFMGLWPARTYKWDEFEGYKTSLVPAKAGRFEHLYLIKGGKKTLKFSELYHSNYSEIKKLVMSQTNFLGNE